MSSSTQNLSHQHSQTLNDYIHTQIEFKIYNETTLFGYPHGKQILTGKIDHEISKTCDLYNISGMRLVKDTGEEILSEIVDRIFNEICQQEKDFQQRDRLNSVPYPTGFAPQIFPSQNLGEGSSHIQATDRDRVSTISSQVSSPRQDNREASDMFPADAIPNFEAQRIRSSVFSSSGSETRPRTIPSAGSNSQSTPGSQALNIQFSRVESHNYVFSPASGQIGSHGHPEGPKKFIFPDPQFNLPIAGQGEANPALLNDSSLPGSELVSPATKSYLSMSQMSSRSDLNTSLSTVQTKKSHRHQQTKAKQLLEKNINEYADALDEEKEKLDIIAEQIKACLSI